MVGAQESRRLLDRLCGYGVSPALWNSIGPKLSAGRVQSAALAALARREQERMKHVSAPYWRVSVQVQAPGHSPFTAAVVSVRGKPLATPKDFGPDGQLHTQALLMTTEQAEQLTGFLRGKPTAVLRQTHTPYTTKPPAPFTTSTMQQDSFMNTAGVRGYSLELRTRIVALVLGGASPDEAARHFSVHVDTVKSYLERHRQNTLHVVAKPTGRHRTVTALHEQQLLAQLETHQDATLQEHADLLKAATGLKISYKTVDRVFRRHKITHKKNAGRQRTH